MVRRAPGPRFEIWEAGDRIHSVDNPVRLKLLHLLEAKPRRLPELVRQTGKAKSTLSELHVRPLLAMGLVSEETDPQDSRSKIYRLLGQRLGSSDVDAPRLRASVLAFASRAGLPSAGALLRAIDPAALVASGADPGYVQALAKRLGELLAAPMKGRQPSEVVSFLDGEFQASALGRLRWEGGEARVEAKPAPLARFLTAVAEAALRAAA